ncbi:two-component system regulatory protein YycI [Jeotgalibacillus proteolyticus]|uniref:two-component system regulatory protein YycI n=1 Tax=Jeotgalibacillus proteolyticus TaxID=2082395 RepID=UPI001430E5A8|nr:two-component system regulatory protein YycI [Jeotgalibacillus proteolyticus]
MDWSKTKTIFIVVFFILNIFLFTLFLKKYQSMQLDELPELTIDQRMAEDNITYSNLPTTSEPHPYLNARVHRFSNTDINELEGQTASVKYDIVLDSQLNTPIDLEDPSSPDELREYIDEYVMGGEQYRLWSYEEEEDRLIYYQHFEDMPIYHNITGRMVVHLNDQDQVISYEQTMLTSIEEFAEDQNLINPRQALEGFYRRNAIEPNSTVVDYELGYYTFIQLNETAAETQVLTPTWRMVFEQEDGDQESLYINAVNPSLIEIDLESLEFEQLEEIEETVE